MKSNAKRILSFVLVLLMSLSMVTGIVLPAAAGTDASDPYAKITGTKDGVAIIPDANVYFFDPAWTAEAPAETGEQFEYTYGDGTTWGNGKTYLLTWGTNAMVYTNANLKSVLEGQSQKWAANPTTVSQDIVVVLAAGQYAQPSYTYLTALATDPTSAQVANVYLLGPQAGKSPVSADKSTKAAAKAIQNSRSTNTATEAVFSNLFPLVRYSNMTVDGIAGNKAFCFYSRNDVGNYSNLTVKNMYIADMTTGFNTTAFICGYASSLNTTWQFENTYINMNTQMTGTKDENNPIYSNKVVFDNCVFAEGKFSKLNPASNTHQTWFLPQKNDSNLSANFLGTYAANPLFEIKNTVVADWESSTLFRFLVNNALYQSYTNNAVKINVTDNKFYDAGTYNGLSAPIFFNSGVSTDVIANSFEAKVTGNLFSFSDEIFNKGTTGSSVAINFNSPTNAKAKFLVKDNVFQAPNNGKVFHVNGFSATGATIDMSGNLFLDNQNNVQPLLIYGGAPENFANGLNVQSDIYASAEKKGGVRELMTVKEVENGTVLYSFIQTRRNGAYSTFDYFTGALTLLLKNGVEYDADTLIKTSCDEVKFLGIYSEEACTAKVDKITQDTINGKYAKLQYVKGDTTLTVVYALNTPRNYLIVDPASAYTTDGYTFNGVTYKPDTAAANGVYAKFYTTIGAAHTASVTHTTSNDRLNSYVGDLLVKGEATYTDRDGNDYAYSNGLNDLILLTPGNHTMHGVAGGNIGSRLSVAVIGPQWGVSPYGEANKEGKLANGRSVDPTKEAVIDGQFTPAADQGGVFSFVIDGAAFVGSGNTSYPINLGHASNNTGSLLQFNAIRNCVFTNASKMILPNDHGATNIKVLYATIEDCAIDVRATDRRTMTDPLINIRPTFGSMKNIAVITQHCLADDDFATINRTDASLMKWTSKLDGFAVDTDSVVFYATEHAEEMVTDYTTSTATCIKGGTATAKCPVCQATATVEVAATGKHEHDTSKWASDATNHFHACKTVGCTDVIDVATHTESEVIVDKAATNIENGTAHTECTECKRVMQSNIILPPTGGDAVLDLAERFEAITATDENRDNILEPQGVIFVDPAFGKAPYTGTFEYTYGDGVTWGNGFTYTLTEGVNAYTKLVDAVLAVQAAWNAADTTVADYKGADTVVLAPATYSWDSWQPTKEIAYDLPTDFVKGNAYDKLFTVNFVGPQAGLSPVTDEIDHADPVQQNGRTADPTKEAVSTGTMWEPKNAYYIVDGMAFAKSHNYHGYASDGLKHPYTAMTLKNIYHQVDEFYAGGVFRFGLWGAGVEQSRYIEFTNYYIKYAQLTDPAKKAQTPTSEALTGDMIIFDNFYEDMTDIEYVTDQHTQGYQKNVYLTPTKYLVPGFAGEGVTGAHLIFKNSVINNHPTAHFMRFKLEGANYADAAQDSLNILFENNLFYNVGDTVRSIYNNNGTNDTTADDIVFGKDPATVVDPAYYTDTLSFQDDWAFPATSGALDFDFVGNTVEWTKEAMEDAYDGNGGTKKKTSGGNIFNINDNNWTDLASYAMENVTQVKHGWDIRDTKMIIPTHELTSKFYLTPTGGKASTAQALAKINDSSSVLVLNENNEVCTWYVSNHLMMDIYATDTFAGGVKELFGVMNGADMAIADWRITINKSSNPSSALPTPGFEGSIMIVPEVTAGTHNPEDLFKFRGDSVEFVELLDKDGNKVTGKVNPNDLDGYKVKARVLGNESVCNVTYTVTIAPESEYVFIDPTNSVTSYEFNGKTYTLNANNRFTDFNAKIPGTNTSLIDYMSGNNNAPAANLPNVVVYLPGTHAFVGNQIKTNMAILGPGFGKDLMDENFSLTNKRGITKKGENSYEIDTTKEAVINGGSITIYRNEVSLFVDGLVLQNGAQIQLMNINSYWWAASGSMHEVTLKNTFVNGVTKNLINGFDNTSRNHVRCIEKGFVCFDEVYVAGLGVTTSKLMLINAAAINTDVNRLYVENLGTNGMIRVGANNGLQMMNHPGTVYLKLTNSKITGVTEYWNMVYGNFVEYRANQTWGGTPEASNDKAFPGGFKLIVDGNTFENNTSNANGYLIRSGTENDDAEAYLTNNTFINTKTNSTQAVNPYTPAFMSHPKVHVVKGNVFINEQNSGILTGVYADLNETKLDISENYWATNDGTKDTVKLITVNNPKYTEKADWYYLDRAMTVRSCDVALVDNGYKAFEDKGFDGINNYVIDASESDQANLFKAVDGATIEGIYADANCTTVTQVMSGTVYVKVSKNGVSLVNKVELTVCDHVNSGVADKITKEPTCYQTGLKDIVCAACGTVLETGKEVAATGNHEWKTEWTVTDTEHYKGCKTDGCPAKNEADTHKESDVITDEAPGCVTAGKGHTECTVCKKVIKAEVAIEATGQHSPKDELVVDTPNSCYADGVGHSVCKDCGILMESNIRIPATGDHKWSSEWVITDDYHYYACTNEGCKHRKDQADHTPGEVIADTAPSCFETGLGHKDCTVCGKTVATNVVIEATGNHEWNTEWVQGEFTHYNTCKTEGCPAHGNEVDHTKKLITVIPETCGDEGVGTYVCEICDKVLEENVVIAPTGKHTKGGIEIYEGMEPNCGYEGLAFKSCTVCGQVVEDNIIVPIQGEHVPGAVITDTAATCTTSGSGHVDCVVCKKTLDTVVVPAGHTPGEWVGFQPGKEAQVCAVCETVLAVRDVLPEGSDPVDPTSRFEDVDEDDWYYEAVEFVVGEGLFNGTSATKFSPDANMTRGMFVTVLGRLHGVKETKASTQFTDVKKSAYYSGYVAWAAKNGIVNGISDTKFAPDANVTREQIAVMMVRYMSFAKISAKKVNTKITFKDASSISGYAKSAVATCQTGGIVNGIKVSGGYNFNPKANATRAQVATIMMNFCENYK